MAQLNHTPRLLETEEALTVLFCLIDDAYALLNPHGARRYECIKRLSDSGRSSPSRSSSSCVAWRASARSCATHRGSSLTCSLEWWDFILPRSIGG
jgi:hypothetical protein